MFHPSKPEGNWTLWRSKVRRGGRPPGRLTLGRDSPRSAHKPPPAAARSPRINCRADVMTDIDRDGRMDRAVLVRQADDSYVDLGFISERETSFLTCLAVQIL